MKKNRQLRKLLTLISTVFFMIFISVIGICSAGDGKFHDPVWDGDTIKEVGKIDINVLLDINDTTSDIDLKSYFTRISEELYDATEKQVQLGSVKIYRGGPEAKDKADLLVTPKVTRSYTYAGYFGKSGARSRIYLNPSTLYSSNPIVVHEMGHSVFGIYDSYLGYLKETSLPYRYLKPKDDATGYTWSLFSHKWDAFTVPAPDTKNTFYDTKNWDEVAKACIMDTPWTEETEFSTPAGNGWDTDHILPYEKTIDWKIAPDKSSLNPSFTATVKVLTMQNYKNDNKSAWETIVDNRSSMKLPPKEPTSDISDHQPIEFDIIPSVHELSISLDRSGSMSGTYLDMAKVAAKMVVALTHEGYEIIEPSGKKKITIPGDYLSITAFDHASMIVFSDSNKVAHMTDNNKTIATQAISNIAVGGATSIGAGLLESSDTFNASNDLKKSIILLSDGHENTAPFVSVVKQSLINEGTRIFAVGLGNGADKQLLRSLSDDTGGQFFYADNANQLPGIFATLYGNLRNDSFLKIVGGILTLLTPSSTQSTEYQMLSPQVNLNVAPSHTENIKIDEAVGEATFLVTWDTGTLNVKLINPGGELITSENFSNFPGIDYIEGQNFIIYRIKDILSGEWIVENSSEAQTDVQWELKVFCIDNDIQFEASTEKTNYLYPEPIIIRASSMAPLPVIGGNATASIINPDGSINELSLFDDGKLLENGDEYANDGVFSGKYTSLPEDGVYTATIKFDSTGATTPTPSNSTGIEFSPPKEDDPPVNAEPIIEFVRYVQFTFSVSGIPETIEIPAAITIGPDVINTKSKGNFITAYIELDEPYNVNNINIESITLNHDSSLVAVPVRGGTVGDEDLDSSLDLMVKFDRNTIANYLELLGLGRFRVEFTLTGELASGEVFKGMSNVLADVKKK